MSTEKFQNGFKKEVDIIRGTVYAIKHNVTGRVYIGATFQSLEMRFYQHFQALKNGKHHNRMMQDDYFEYGNDYSCYWICSCDTDGLTLRLIERLCMDALGTRDEKHGYNAIDKTAPLSVDDLLEVDKFGTPILTRNGPRFSSEMPRFSGFMSMRESRIHAGLTLEDVAKRLCTTRQSVSCWELGRYAPSGETKQKLSELYCVPLWMTAFW